MHNLSVIIPVYNCEKYLNYCLHSIITQSYTDFELLLINDGSTDRSLDICNKFASRDQRIKVITKENSGVSDTRNLGLSLAKGKYLTFVDGDDWLPQDCFENSIHLLENNDNDVLCGSIVTVWPHADIKIEVENGTYDLNNKRNALEQIYNMHEGVCSKFYKREVIVKNKINFNKNIRNGEDSIFFHIVMSVCKSFITTSNVLYYYNKLEKNTLVTKFNEDLYKWRTIEQKARSEAYKIWADDTNNYEEAVINRKLYFFDELTSYYLNNSYDDKLCLDSILKFKEDCLSNIKLKNEPYLGMCGIKYYKLLEMLEKNDINNLRKKVEIKNQINPIIFVIKEYIKGFFRLFKSRKYQKEY